MELHPGVFVSMASTDDWESDPDVPGSQMHELVHADGLWAGLTRFTSVDGPVPWTPERREVALILKGSARIEIAGGDALDLGVGICSRFLPASRPRGTSQHRLKRCGCSVRTEFRPKTRDASGPRPAGRRRPRRCRREARS
jgi:hypothetical protein